MVRLLAACALLFCAPTARAGGYFYSDSGVVALGRSGAWVAGANTQFAQYYNPAGIIHIEDPTVNVGWSGVQQNVAFDRTISDDPSTPEVESGHYPTADNQASPYDVPELGFASPILRDKLAFAIGFTSPYSPSSLYDADGAQRYTVIDTSIYQFAITPTLAYRPIKYVTFGASFQWKYLQVAESLKVTTSGTDDPVSDVGVSVKATDLFTPSANFGLLIDPVDPLTIGLAFEPATKFHATGNGTLDFTGNGLETVLNTSVYSDDDVHLDISIPLTFRAGVAVRPIHRLELEAALVYQQWSALEHIEIQDVNVTLDFNNPLFADNTPPVPETFTLPAGLTDTVSYRFGGELRPIDELAFRAGTFFENGSLSPENVSVALYDPSKFQVSAGASGFLLGERLRLDAAFAWLVFKPLTVTDSTVVQVNALGGPAQVVGNGDYRSHGWVLGFAGSWTFKHHEPAVPAAVGGT